MTQDELEAAIAEFLEGRDQDPALTPRTFVDGRSSGDAADILAAIRTTLELEGLFPGEGATPRRIGDYDVVEEIGRGGMGIVYRARREDALFALKLLPMAPFVGPHALARFRREARALASLSHPNIVRIRDTGVHDEMPYLVMDLVEGEALEDVILSLSAGEAAALMHTLCGAVHAAHAQGLLHRDLKPQNVVVQSDGTPILLDFGLSVSDENPTLTSTGQLLGTPRYMAPEQVRGQAGDARTDVYALGLILYELLTKRPARPEQGRESILAAARAGRITAPRHIDPGIPAPLERIVLVALSPDPRHRYADAAHMADDLRRYIDGTRVRAAPRGRLRRLAERLRDGMRRQAAYAGDAPTSEQALVDATTAWLDGRRDAARQAAARARRANRANVAAQALADHLAGRAPTPGVSQAADALRAAMQAFEEGNHRDAIAALDGLTGGDRASPIAAALRGLCGADAEDHERAEPHLVQAAERFPQCARLHRALGRTCEALDRLPEAVRAYSRAAAIDPASPDIWTDIAAVHLKQLDLDAGLAAVARARALAPAEDARMLRTFAALTARAGKDAESRRILQDLLAQNPADDEAWYLLGYAFDRDHMAVEAEEAYQRAVALRPSYGEALVCLANLYAGASSGQCKGCDEVYRAHPALLDMARAEEAVLRGLSGDAGRSAWVTRSLRDVAARLPSRQAVIRHLEALTRDRERTAAVVRLEDMLRRLRLLEGEG